MSGLTENHKHVRRRLEPLKLAVASPAVTQVNGSRTRVCPVEAFGVQYHGRTIVDAGMDWSCGGKKPHLANRFVEECVRLSQLRHPNLSILYGILSDGPSLTLLTELPAMSLDECLGRYEAVPDFLKISILLDAARGLLYLHKQKPSIAHTRISTKAIYLSSSMSAMIGDVGVAGAFAAEDAARRDTTSERMPPQTFVNIVETGTKCTDAQVDIPAFGNVVVHTVCQQMWVDPLGHTAVSPYIHTMHDRHPLYSLAYYCLLGGLQLYTHKQVPQVDMDYVVQYLQHSARNTPPPFPNTLELFQTLGAMEKQLHTNKISPQHNTCTVQENHLVNGHNSVPHKKFNECSRQAEQPCIPSSSSGIPHPLTCSTKSSGNSSHFLHPSDSGPGLVAPHTQSEDQYSSRRNSTGQVRAPPPKPPQRSSSFRRNSSDQVMSKHTENSFQRAGSLRIRRSSSPPPPPPELPTSSQLSTSPIIKTVGGVFGGGVKQTSLLLPSKFSVRDDFKVSSRGQRTEQQSDPTSPPASSLQPTSIPPQTTRNPPPPDLSSSLEFERLLARQREKVDAKLPTTSLNGTVIHLSPDKRRSATDLDLPKKIAPKPPRRTSSFKSSQRPTKYESYSNHTSEVALKRHTVTESELAVSCSTSPSTGQTRPSSVGYLLQN